MGEGLNNEEIEERFFVRGRMEILTVLNDLIYRCEPVTVSFSDGPDILTTTLLEANERGLIFDVCQDAAANQRLLMCSACSFVAYPDGIRVQFSGHQVSQILWGDSAAYSISLPERVARLQRQQSFRILIPTLPSWTVKLFSNSGTSLGAWQLHDLSVGGLGVTVNAQWRLGRGQTIARATLALPGYGEIDCAVTLRHETGLAEPADDGINSPFRIGLAFVNLLPETGVAIQRTIIKIEHERRSADLNGDADDNY